MTTVSSVIAGMTTCRSHKTEDVPADRVCAAVFDGSPSSTPPQATGSITATTAHSISAARTQGETARRSHLASGLRLGTTATAVWSASPKGRGL